MKLFFFSFFSALSAMLAIDAVWLTAMSKRFYSRYIGHLMADKPDLVPAGIFYLIYISALSVLVIVPAIKGGYAPAKTFALGALFGLAAYATYDLTNQATLKEWPAIVTLIDLAWGALLTGFVALAATAAVKYFYSA